MRFALEPDISGRVLLMHQAGERRSHGREPWFQIPCDSTLDFTAADANINALGQYILRRVFVVLEQIRDAPEKKSVAAPPHEEMVPRLVPPHGLFDICTAAIYFEAHARA